MSDSRTVNVMARIRQFDMFRHPAAPSDSSIFELQWANVLSKKRLLRFAKIAVRIQTEVDVRGVDRLDCALHLRSMIPPASKGVRDHEPDAGD